MSPRIVLLSTVVVATAAVASTAEPVVKLSFRDTIKPVLREKCAHCHNRKTLPDKVSFESKKLAFTKTKAGQPIIVPGKPDESLMVLAIESPVFHEKAMPLVGPRPNVDEIALIRRWIAEGAEWPDGPVGRIKPLFHPKE
jgi:mono/diheme cytochrome c family protein